MGQSLRGSLAPWSQHRRSESVAELRHQDAWTKWNRRLDKLPGRDVRDCIGIEQVAAGELRDPVVPRHADRRIIGGIARYRVSEQRRAGWILRRAEAVWETGRLFLTLSCQAATGG